MFCIRVRVWFQGFGLALGLGFQDNGPRPGLSWDQPWWELRNLQKISHGPFNTRSKCLSKRYGFCNIMKDKCWRTNKAEYFLMKRITLSYPGYRAQLRAHSQKNGSGGNGTGWEERQGKGWEGLAIGRPVISLYPVGGQRILFPKRFVLCSHVLVWIVFHWWGQGLSFHIKYNSYVDKIMGSRIWSKILL